MSNTIQIGILSGQMKPVYALWPGYSDSDVTNEEVAPVLSGSIDSLEGTQRLYFRGQFEVSRHFPSNYADHDFLLSVYNHPGFIYFRDHQNQLHSVAWIGQFNPTFVDQGGHLVRIPFELIEKT